MDRRYQVFISSTYEDLREERGGVMQSLLALDCIPTGMELFPAADDDSWTHIKRFIQRCDYYIVIVGGRYGTWSNSGKSYTEMEYDYAVEAQIPVLAFLHKSPETIPVCKTDSDDRAKAALGAFRKKIESARHARYWSTAEELALLVTQAMVSVTKTTPRVGWVRADLVPGEGTAQEMLKLQQKITALEARIAENEANPPAGTEALAQGDEEFSIRFRSESRYGERVEAARFSWNALLTILGPALIRTASEAELKSKLAEVFANRCFDESNLTVYNVLPRDEDFQRVKVQFRALGLIREVRARTEHGEALAGWTLTPYGDRLMTKVSAIRTSKTGQEVATNS